MDKKRATPAVEGSPERLLAEGKTKRIYASDTNDEHVIVVAKDDITAGDGKKHDIIADKGRLANETTCNVFRLLGACGLPVGFIAQRDPTSFIAPRCQMLPYEVVVRREAHGSFLKRNPHLTRGQLFASLKVELFLKTNGRRWKTHELICDDPLMQHDPASRQISLFDPGQPRAEPFLVLDETEIFDAGHSEEVFAEMRALARRAFWVLEKAWQLKDRKLVDFKVELGLDPQGKLLLADVIDNDSWRVVENGRYIDKQVYRDGGSLDTVADKYRQVAKLTRAFRVPAQRIIIWRGSQGDDVSEITRALGELDGLATVVTCSAHKEPIAAVCKLQELVQEVPDTVVIAYIGMSNGAGPTLSAASTVPVITVPAHVEDHPEDVWSSLRAPSKVPVMTVLNPKNAALAALQILSARNPLIYAHLRAELESRAVNTLLLLG